MFREHPGKQGQMLPTWSREKCPEATEIYGQWYMGTKGCFSDRYVHPSCTLGKSLLPSQKKKERKKTRIP